VDLAGRFKQEVSARAILSPCCLGAASVSRESFDQTQTLEDVEAAQARGASAALLVTSKAEEKSSR
jgi:hypothetical protein